VVQQGSFWAQMGTCTPVFTVPAGNQQQQPPQSIQLETCGSAPQLHVELLELLEVLLLFELLEVVLLLELLEVPLLELVEVLPLGLVEVPPLELLGVVLLVPLFVVFCADVLDPLDADPPSPVDVLSLLQAARPTVDEAPMTTMTWKSRSICIDKPFIPNGVFPGVPFSNRRSSPRAKVSEFSHPRQVLESTRARARFIFLAPSRGVPTRWPAAPVSISAAPRDTSCATRCRSGDFSRFFHASVFPEGPTIDRPQRPIQSWKLENRPCPSGIGSKPQATRSSYVRSSSTSAACTNGRERAAKCSGSGPFVHARPASARTRAVFSMDSDAFFRVESRPPRPERTKFAPMSGTLPTLHFVQPKAAGLRAGWVESRRPSHYS
jgi:hypothetical protein